MEQFPAPLSGNLGGAAKGIPVRLRDGQSDYFAVLVTFRHWDNSILYIYSSTGVLVYQEILGQGGSAIAALTAEKAGHETLPVGGAEKVWQYRLTEQT